MTAAGVRVACGLLGRLVSSEGCAVLCGNEDVRVVYARCVEVRKKEGKRVGESQEQGAVVPNALVSRSRFQGAPFFLTCLAARVAIPARSTIPVPSRCTMLDITRQVLNRAPVRPRCPRRQSHRRR